MPPPGYREFEFDLPQALLINLVRAFDSMEGASLMPDLVTAIPEAQGVYQLFHQGALVYIGKTDAQAGLRERLTRHAWTVQHRKNLDPAQVSFKAIRVFVFTAIDLETQLIQHYRASGPVAWNFSGFGSNDPGRERDTTNIKPEGFDAQFPVDLDRKVVLDVASPAFASEALTALRRALPYTFRFESAGRGSRKPHPDLEEAAVSLPSRVFTTRELLVHIARSLPPGWQATLLAGRVILYKENREYPFGEVIVRSGS
jgi:hypothetical protein